MKETKRKVRSQRTRSCCRVSGMPRLAGKPLRKECESCQQQIPVACKTCPECRWGPHTCYMAPGRSEPSVVIHDTCYLVPQKLLIL